MNDIQLDEHSLAYELLVEMKHNAKRWFVAFCVMVVLELLTIIGFMWYISLPSEETSQLEQTKEEMMIYDNNDVKQSIGE